MKIILEEIGNFSTKYSEAVVDGKNKEWAWEMEGRVFFEVASMFVGVGAVKAVSTAGKEFKYVNSLRLALNTKLTKLSKARPNSKFKKIVDEFMKGANCISKANCFVAGTQIVTAEGTKKIEEIKVGDFVLSKNVKTAKTDYKPVTQLFTVKHTELFTLTYKDKEGEEYELKVSGEHPFWVADKGWVTARELAIADKLEITDNTQVEVIKITNENAKANEPFITYNFEVDETHTYYVLQEGKKNYCLAVLVHNTNPCGVRANYLQGMLGQDIVRARLMNSKTFEIVGEQLRIVTTTGERYVDFLVKSKKSNRRMIIEVKTGNATRTLSQRTKDIDISLGNSYFKGRRSRNLDIDDFTPSGKIRTFEVNADNLRK